MKVISRVNKRARFEPIPTDRIGSDRIGSDNHESAPFPFSKRVSAESAAMAVGSDSALCRPIASESSRRFGTDRVKFAVESLFKSPTTPTSQSTRCKQKFLCSFPVDVLIYIFSLRFCFANAPVAAPRCVVVRVAMATAFTNRSHNHARLPPTDPKKKKASKLNCNAIKHSRITLN